MELNNISWIITGVKGLAGILVALASIYGVLFTLGLAPVSNSFAEKLVVRVVSEKLADIATRNQLQLLDNKANRNSDQIKDLDDNVDQLKIQNGIIDERTKQILNSQKRIQDLLERRFNTGNNN